MTNDYSTTELVQALRETADAPEGSCRKAKDRIFKIAAANSTDHVHLRSGPFEMDGERITLGILESNVGMAHAFPLPAEARRIAIALLEHAEAVEGLADDE